MISENQSLKTRSDGFEPVNQSAKWQVLQLMLGKRLNYSWIQTFLQIRNDEPSEN